MPGEGLREHDRQGTEGHRVMRKWAGSDVEFGTCVGDTTQASMRGVPGEGVERVIPGVEAGERVA